MDVVHTVAVHPCPSLKQRPRASHPLPSTSSLLYLSEDLPMQEPAPSLDTVCGYVEPASSHVVDDSEPVCMSALTPGGRPRIRASPPPPSSNCRQTPPLCTAPPLRCMRG
nr:uncharacterized protein LOC127327128 [Lolium perenne]